MIFAFHNSKINTTRYVEIQHIIGHEPDKNTIKDAIMSYCDGDEDFDFDLMIADVLSSFGLYWSFINVNEFNV